MLPPALIAAVKRHPLYRRVHCHLTASCPQDGWIEADGDRAFVVFAIHPVDGVAAAVGFAVDVNAAIVVASRLVLHMPDGVLSKAIESLPSCERRAEHRHGQRWFTGESQAT